MSCSNKYKSEGGIFDATKRPNLALNRTLLKDYEDTYKGYEEVSSPFIT